MNFPPAPHDFSYLNCKGILASKNLLAPDPAPPLGGLPFLGTTRVHTAALQSLFPRKRLLTGVHPEN